MEESGSSVRAPAATGGWEQRPRNASEPRARALTEEERQMGSQRMNTASSGPSPYVEGSGGTST